jgi:hypothetical protein
MQTPRATVEKRLNAQKICLDETTLIGDLTAVKFNCNSMTAWFQFLREGGKERSGKLVGGEFKEDYGFRIDELHFMRDQSVKFLRVSANLVGLLCLIYGTRNPSAYIRRVCPQ